MRRILASTLRDEGMERVASGNPGTAYDLLRMAALLARSDAEVHFQAARAASLLGKKDDAVRYCERALRLDASLPAAHQLLMDLFLHGESYVRVLERIHALLKPRTYVEIGVAEGQTLRLVGSQAHAVGIDPSPTLAFTLPSNVRLFTQTSDAFFARSDVQTLLGGHPVDLAFIDGMHHFEFALRDFLNLEKLCHRGSVILVHDCFPHDRRTSQRARQAQFWTGDVWRMIVLLKNYRPDLTIHTVAAPPSGLCIVRNVDPTSRVLAENIKRLVDEFMQLDYAYLERDRATKLNLVPNDWEHVREILTR